jgi:prepilin-type N-terminal cleavage/methylation domain-containing protein
MCTIVQQATLYYTNHMHKRHRGFTLVELLIVVIVIGILARIVVVTFQGAQDRAITASMTSDLRSIAKQMDAARSANNGKYPTTIPGDIKPSKNNVVQMTSVASTTNDYCINMYGPANKMMSVKADGSVNDYLCPGTLIGSSVGGSVPAVPKGVNLVADFSTWTTSGDITYNSASKEMRCGGTSVGNAQSPLFRVNGAATGTFTYDGMATTATSTRASSGSYVGSQYRANDGTTAAYNAAPSPGPYSGNGSAPAFSSLNSWQTINFAMTLGPNVIYMYVTVNCSPVATSYYTSDTRYRNPIYKLN